LPGKKQAVSAKLKSWQLTVAVIAGVASIVGGVGVFAYQSYTQGQISAVETAETAIEFGERSIEDISGLIDALELAIRNSEETIVNTDGQTLDEQERDALLAEIELGKEIWVAQKTQLLELEAAVKALKSQLSSNTESRGVLIELTGEINRIANSDWSPSSDKIVALGERINSVITAQSQWAEKQKKIAADKAAAELAKAEKEAAERAAAQLAEIERAAAESLARQATETTTITAPPASSQPVEDPSILTAAMIAAQNYILNLASNITFLWDPDLCEVGYVCGKANPAPFNNPGDFLHASARQSWGYTGAPRTPEHAHVFVLLDNSFDEFYTSSSLGRAILVHEAAHVRQWFKYGDAIVSASEAQTQSGRTGVAAVEYMADCATFVILRRTTGAYTSQCTPAELQAAATIWQ
jgi:hypothetical protein